MTPETFESTNVGELLITADSACYLPPVYAQQPELAHQGGL